MANPQFQPSSFIPKKNPVSSPMPGQQTRRSVNVFLLISAIIFVISILSAGGVFIYEQVANKNIEEQKNQLERAKDAFDPRLIEELARLDKRISVAEALMADHITVSPFFELLSSLTLQSISFESFSFTKDDLGNLGVEMSGVSKNYTSIALQSDLLGNNENIIDPIFSNFVLDEDGNVSFELSLFLNNNFLLYENSID